MCRRCRSVNPKTDESQGYLESKDISMRASHRYPLILNIPYSPPTNTSTRTFSESKNSIGSRGNSSRAGLVLPDVRQVEPEYRPLDRFAAFPMMACFFLIIMCVSAQSPSSPELPLDIDDKMIAYFMVQVFLHGMLLVVAIPRSRGHPSTATLAIFAVAVVQFGLTDHTIES
ncbi:hypothetical protein PM082_000128 [Marasmius tenuissimus]|nr:hypothetical protein PM082_000128 [Marasmius tenuissimus]